MGYVSSVSSNVLAYEPITTSGEVSFTGLGNGTDFQEIIDVTVAAESYQLEEYESQKAENEYIVDLLEQLQDEIESLNETLDEMDEPDEFYTMEGSSSGDEVDVEVTGEAAIGVHTVVVDQLAQNDVWVNEASNYPSEDTVLTSTATTLDVEFGGETISIDVAAGTTLEGLVSTINNSVEARDKFEADIFYNGDSYNLVLRSEDAGEENGINITNTGTLGFDPADFTNTQAAQNSRIKVDGYPAGADQWIERDTNSIDDAVDGITFDLKEPTDSNGVRISVDYDTDGMADTITSFVEEVNQIILDIQILTGRVTEEEDSEEDTFTIDNYAMDIMYGEIKSIISSGALGFAAYDEDEGGDYYNALSQIGFSTDVDEGSASFGQLILDEEELEEALEKDPEAVAELFSARASGESDSEDFQVSSVIDTVTPAGEYDINYTIAGGEIVSATINGENAFIEDGTILGTSADSKGLLIAVTNFDEGDHSGTARVKQGKVGELSDALDSMVDEEVGTLSILINNYEESVTSLDNQIYNEEKRLDTLESSLIRKYASLDATLSLYENRSSLLESQLAQLS